MKPSEDGINIKGSREGLLITLGPGAWHNALGALETRLTATPEFFKGARVALLVGTRKLVEADVRAARDLLAHHDVVLWGISGDDEETRHVAAVLGLDAQLLPRDRAELRPRPVEPPIEPPTPIETAHTTGPLEPSAVDDPEAGLIARRTLRSGQQLRHPGSITIIGDVNPGAEIVAGGDIVVWGKLRGTVHAGAMGNETAVVCALDLAPTQLRIAQFIARSPEGRRRKPAPEVARVRAGKIVAESWEMK
ncbi:putative septum site-determining protein MinC [Thermoflexales bacterium]|nr:putative septum site-determining protein MinC [Thermoflexales bacterium]